MNGRLPLLPVIWTLAALLGLCVMALVGLSLANAGSADLRNSLLGLAGLCIAALVGLLGAQQGQLHTSVNSRMDELVSATRDAAFQRGQAAEQARSEGGPPPQAPPPS